MTVSTGRRVAAVKTPGFFEHLRLLWGLRLDIGLNQGSGHRRPLAVLGFLASSAPAVGLVIFFYRLVRAAGQSSFELWPDFIVRLLCFVTTCVWVIWPVMSAGVDDHSEISRYASFPISSFRLMLASTLASLFEPRALVFYGPLLGASLGYLAERPGHFTALNLLAFMAYVLMNASLSRVGLHVVLNVLRQPRSAELLGGGFVVMLIAASFIPPVDTSWLTRVRDLGVDAVPDALVANATVALGRFPTGYFAHGLLMSANGWFAPTLADALALVELTMLALVVAWGLLLQFHRHSGRGGAQSATARTTNPFATTQTTFATLVAREALDLWNNPRARLLASVPFVLGILLKLLSGRDLFVFFFGATADAWVLGSLAVYGAIVLASTFSQNAFAYDGQGFSVFLTSPLELGLVLKAKNTVHALAGAVMGTLVIVFYVAYFRTGALTDVLCAVLAVTTLVPVLLTGGNFLSVFFPVKFHANLKRRDKLPFIASMLGVAAASLGTAPFAWGLRAVGTTGPTVMTLLTLALATLAAWGLYAVTLPLALRLLGQRRELILRAVTRE